jgi:transcriptional regulator with XRE-family HTH domain
MAIFTDREPDPTSAMSRTQRDIATRLELTRIALDVSTPIFCENVGLSDNQWSQYIDPDPDRGRRITIDVMYRLKDEYGVTFDWIFDGDRSRLPADLLEKIRHTERLGPVDLSRKRGRKPKRRPL